MGLRNNQGITLISLVIYISLMVGIIGMIATFKSNIDYKLDSMSEYISVIPEMNGINMYMLGEAAIDNNKVLKRSSNGDYIEFSSGNSYMFTNNGLYKNSIKVVSNIDNCLFDVIKENGNDVLCANVQLGGSEPVSKTLKYVMKSPRKITEIRNTDTLVTAVLSASNIAETSFTLTAKGADLLSGVAKYEFYIDNILANTVNSTVGTVLYNVTGKLVRHQYSCKVRVYNAKGEYKESDAITVTTRISYNKVVTKETYTSISWITPTLKAGTYGFNESGTTFVSSNNAVNSSISWGYFRLDLSYLDTTLAMNINYTYSSEANYDFSTCHLTTTTSQPTYSSATNRIYSNSGATATLNATYNITTPGIYYLHFQYRKDGSVNTSNDRHIINSITFQEQ